MATDVVDTLNDLIATCKDEEYSLRSCAEHTASSQLRELFIQSAEDCARASRELQSQVAQLGQTPDTGGTAGGALHRGWVALRGSLTGYTDEAMLEEGEHGEGTTMARYRAALTHELPEDVRTLVERQAQGMQHNHDQIKALRERARSH